MRNVRMTICLMAAVVFFATYQASAMVFDHFNNGQLDPAWAVTFQNASGWTYAESGTNLSVSDINTFGDSQIHSRVLLMQDFLAPGDFEIKSGFSWYSESLSTEETLRIQAYSGDKVIAEGGYSDGWKGSTGGPFAVIGQYTYGNKPNMLPYSGTAELTLKRISGTINILWNDQLVLTGHDDEAIDKLAIAFEKQTDVSGIHFDGLSVDYINAVPEPATILFLGIGSCCVLSRRKRAAQGAK